VKSNENQMKVSFQKSNENEFSKIKF